jgi:hypothetical protein
MSEVKSSVNIEELRIFDEKATEVLDRIIEAVKWHCGKLYRVDENKYYECIASYADKSILDIAEELEGYRKPYIPHWVVEGLKNLPKKYYDILENYLKKEFNRFLKVYQKRLALQTT